MRTKRFFTLVVVLFMAATFALAQRTFQGISLSCPPSTFISKMQKKGFKYNGRNGTTYYFKGKYLGATRDITAYTGRRGLIDRVIVVLYNYNFKTLLNSYKNKYPDWEYIDVPGEAYSFFSHPGSVSLYRYGNKIELVFEDF